jgi:hypothetical protein
MLSLSCTVLKLSCNKTLSITISIVLLYIPLLKMSTRNIRGGKGGLCVRLATSPPSRAVCHEIWEPKPPGTLWTTPGLLRDSFTFCCFCISKTLHWKRRPRIKCWLWELFVSKYCCIEWNVTRHVKEVSVQNYDSLCTMITRLGEIVRFELHTSVLLKVFWDVMLCCWG